MGAESIVKLCYKKSTNKKYAVKIYRASDDEKAILKINKFK